MSGHSKWSKIQHKKGKADAARSNVFTKLSRAITLASRQGGADSEMNFSLRLAIEKAKAANMPKDNIERAVKKGSGELADGAKIEEILYEGFGSNGVGILVDTITDNTNRTVSEVKHTLSKHGGSLGAPGSVQWKFERKGVVLFSNETKQKIENWEDLQLILLDSGVDDIREEDEGVEITCPVEQFSKLLEAIKEQSIEPDNSGLEWLPKEKMSVDDGVESNIDALVDALLELDDVRDVYTVL